MDQREEQHAVGADHLEPEERAVLVDVVRGHGEDPSGPDGEEVQHQKDQPGYHHPGLQTPGDAVAQRFQHIQIPHAAQYDPARQIEGVDQTVDKHGAGKGAALDEQPQGIQR